MSKQIPELANVARPQSDLAQILAHGPAYRESYGKALGALLMLFAIAKGRRGVMSVATTAGLVGTLFYDIFWK